MYRVADSCKGLLNFTISGGKKKPKQAAPAKARRRSSKSLQGFFMPWKPWGNFFAAFIHKSTYSLNKAWTQTEAYVAIGNLLSLSSSVHNETPLPCLLLAHHKFRDQSGVQPAVSSECIITRVPEHHQFTLHWPAGIYNISFKIAEWLW